MRRILTSLLQLFPPKRDDLVEREGILYEIATMVAFTGRVTKGWEQGEVRNGKRVGQWYGYQDNGRIQWEVPYKDGKKDGIEVWYHENGQYFRDKITYKDGKKANGPEVWHYENGQLRQEGTYKDGRGDGPCVWYHKNGQLGSKGTYKDSKREGPWVSYNANGTVDHLWTGTFKDDVRISD